MASPAMAMERPPVPPDVAAQIGRPGGGPPPFAGVGAQMAAQAQAGNPVKTAYDATEKLWENIVRAEPRMGPFVERAKNILKQGLDLISKGSPPGAPGGPEGPGAPGGGPGGPGAEVPPGPQPRMMPG